MDNKLFEELRKDIKKEIERKKEKKAVTLYLSEDNLTFLKAKKINVSRMVDTFLSSMVVFIKSDEEKSKKLEEQNQELKTKEKEDDKTAQE
jgi:post-segregation antitoxin (ccd killing protein)